LAGLILNGRSVQSEIEIVTEFAEQLHTRVVVHIPRDRLIQECEARNSTVAIDAPDSALGRTYARLATFMLENQELQIPRALSRQQLLDILANHSVAGNAVYGGSDQLAEAVAP
jgi:nitrogenase iron protein NifH